MKVGDKVWLFDYNRRIYPKTGGISSSPIYVEYFYQAIIDRETSRSWVVLNQKFPKKNPIGIYTDEQKNDKIWDYENRPKIVRLVEQCSTDKLKQIEKILALQSKLSGLMEVENEQRDKV